MRISLTLAFNIERTQPDEPDEPEQHEHRDNDTLVENAAPPIMGFAAQ